MTFQVFSEDPAVSKAPFFIALNAVGRMKANMGKGRLADEIFWKLVTGPIEFMWTFSRMEAACHMQNQWEQTVLAEKQSLNRPPGRATALQARRGRS